MLKTVNISIDTLKSLINDSLHWQAYTNAGVDNWTWAGEAENDFLKGRNMDDFDELTRQELNMFIEIQPEFLENRLKFLDEYLRKMECICDKMRENL